LPVNGDLRQKRDEFSTATLDPSAAGRGVILL
jgi:hypothetical protein